MENFEEMKVKPVEKSLIKVTEIDITYEVIDNLNDNNWEEIDNTMFSIKSEMRVNEFWITFQDYKISVDYLIKREDRECLRESINSEAVYSYSFDVWEVNHQLWKDGEESEDIKVKVDREKILKYLFNRFN